MRRLSFLGSIAVFAYLFTLAEAACSYNTPTCATMTFMTIAKTPGCLLDMKCACSKLGTYDELSLKFGDSCGKSDKEKTLSSLVAFCKCVGVTIQSTTPSSTTSVAAAAPTPSPETTISVQQQSITPAQQTTSTTSSLSELPKSTSTFQTVISASKSSQAIATAPAATSTSSQPPISTTTGSGGYSTSDKIALGVGIGFGLPTVLLAFIGVWAKCR